MDQGETDFYAAQIATEGELAIRVAVDQLALEHEWHYSVALTIQARAFELLEGKS